VFSVVVVLVEMLFFNDLDFDTLDGEKQYDNHYCKPVRQRVTNTVCTVARQLISFFNHSFKAIKSINAVR
jgi:hypothetical protein